MTDLQWQHANNILCVRLDYLGDVLMTTPALRALKQSHPERRITLLTSSSGAAAAPYITEIAETIEYAAPWMKSSNPCQAADELAMIHLLAQHRFDAAVIFTVYSQNPLPAAMLCYLAGIPLRLAHCRENPYQLLTHWIHEIEPQERVRHEVRRQLDLVATIGAHTEDERLAFRIPTVDMAWAKNCLHQLDVDRDKPWIVMHPGASAPSRRYPATHWTAAARELATLFDCTLVFTGNKEEASLVEEIRAQVPRSHSLAGQLDLGKLAALISLAPLLISSNTGPAHLSAAVGTPVVDLYALTNPQHTPWLVPSRVLFHDVPCRFCYRSVCPHAHQHCLTKVDPKHVVDAALSLLNHSRSGGNDKGETVTKILSFPPERE